ncbi:MAG: cation transporting ATPase C-terminal domain-containing protein [Candidatus Bathyarchaeia archaeon]|jgi:hypothetical protein
MEGQFGQPLAVDNLLYLKSVTMAFAIVVAQVGNVITCRTNKQSTFKNSLTKNKWIIWV